MKRAKVMRIKRGRRARRTRAWVRGTADRPRLSVHRSGRHVSAQLIDDAAGVTLASATDTDLTLTAAGKQKPASRMERAERVGAKLAASALIRGIRTARFDRGPYRYHGLVKALAEGARRGGLKL